MERANRINHAAKLFLALILGLVMAGCDAQRNELILGLFQTATPIPPTATATSAPTITLTPEPTETLIPLEEPSRGDHYFLIGDFKTARSEYRKSAFSAASEKEIAAAELGLARIESQSGEYEACQNRLIEALNRIGDPALKAPLWYQMATCLHELELRREEINALSEYLKANPESRLAFEIQERIGDLYFAEGDYQDAMTIYSGLAERVDFISGNQVWMKVADTFFIQGDYSNALLVWIKIFEANQNEELRVRINLLMAETYEIIDSTEQAYARYQDIVNSYPRAAGALDALQALNNADQDVNLFQSGLIYYYRGNYKLASANFYRFLESGESGDGALIYYLGVSQMYVGNYVEAISLFDKLIEEFPEDGFYAPAWEEKAYVQWYYQGNYPAGAATLLEYVAKHPDQQPAPGYLFQAGRVLETAHKLSDAAEVWERLIDEYPLYEKSEEALFLAGIARYRAGNYDAATATFNRELLIATDTADVAKANFWIGKSYQRKGDAEFAEKYFLAASSASPTDYYTERALDLLSGAEPFQFAAPSEAISGDIANEKIIADQWMRITFNIDESVDLMRPTLLIADSDFLRAEELYRLGRFQEALEAYDAVRVRFDGEVVTSYQLMNTLIEKEIYRPAVFISRGILTHAGLIEDVRTLSAPNYFNRIRFGTWYSESVLAAWEEFGIHPFVLYGMMRQESMYDPWISSAAGAQGLMQFMPATGREMAEKLKWPENYGPDDLLRAAVSVRFAGKYLSGQLSYFDQNPYHMLASYNAGAGNTANWIDDEDGDTDLFLEMIRFEETRLYVRRVYENAKMYERLYR